MLVGFMASRTGRWLRILLGVGMIVRGLSSGSSRGVGVAVAGLGPLLAGALDLCLLGPLFGYPVRGEEIRRSLGLPEELRLFKTHYEQLPPSARILLH